MSVKEELEDFAKTSRRAMNMVYAALIFVIAYALSGFLAISGSMPEMYDAGDEAMYVAVYAFTVAAVCGVVMLMAFFKSRIGAVILWLPIALFWIDIALIVASGRFPGVPWLAAIGTYMAAVGTPAVFRYQKLMKEERQAAAATPVEVFE